MRYLEVSEKFKMAAIGTKLHFSTFLSFKYSYVVYLTWNLHECTLKWNIWTYYIKVSYFELSEKFKMATIGAKSKLLSFSSFLFSYELYITWNLNKHTVTWNIKLYFIHKQLVLGVWNIKNSHHKPKIFFNCLIRKNVTSDQLNFCEIELSIFFFGLIYIIIYTI